MPKQPIDILNEMMAGFERASTSLMKITARDIVQGEKAVYGKIYAKPSKRLSALLSVDREILVLFSNFTDQQARTIQKARDVMLEERSRLENTVAIIVHKDTAGNHKLKKWGRESGLTVLPVYVRDRVPPGDEFEKILCGELYSHDPFDVTGPVSDDSQFYGRRTEAQDLARKLQAGQIRACLGIRKIGKTSIINRVINEAKQYHGCRCIMIDCSKDNVWSMNASQLMDSLAQGVTAAITSSSGYSAVSPSTFQGLIAHSANALLTAVAATEDPIILFFDEVDYITPGSPTAKHWHSDFNTFWRNLRAVYQETTRAKQNLSMVISGVSSKWFSVESIEGIENAALAFVPEEYLSPLPRGATIAMIRTIARTSGLQFDDTNADLVAEFCGDMPFWVRKACSYIHRQIDIQVRPIRPDEALLMTLLNNFLQTEGAILAQVALRHLFRVYPELEEVAVSCYKSQAGTSVQYLLTTLERYGVVSKRTGSMRISGNMMEQGLRLYLEHNIEIPKPDVQGSTQTPEALSFQNIDEWADELALISKRRNILERRMRSIAVNFVRYDSLQNKQKGTTSERLLKILKEDDRKKYQNLSAEEIVEKYLWTDLVKLINREWPLFERVFKDKPQFDLNCNVINDRYDTHAKDADRADLALYRRSLKWLEDSVRSI